MGKQRLGQTTRIVDADDDAGIRGRWLAYRPLKTDGTVAGWGQLAHNQINIPAGLSNVIAVSAGKPIPRAQSGRTVVRGALTYYGSDYSLINVPAGLSNVVSIAAGYDHNVALKMDGTVTAWGYSIYGQTNIPAGCPTSQPLRPASVALALRANGTVVGWGCNSAGQATPPDDLTKVKAIAAGGNYTASHSNQTEQWWFGAAVIMARQMCPSD